MATNLTQSFDSMFKQMENLISSKTVVGQPVTVNDVIIVPLIEVSFGVGAGGVGDGKEGKEKDGSGGFMGAKMSPSAVIVVVNGTAQLINVKHQESLNKLIDLVPGILSKLNLEGLLGKKKEEKEETLEYEKGETID